MRRFSCFVSVRRVTPSAFALRASADKSANARYYASLNDTVGNIVSKSDVGTYAYNPPGGPLPHAVMSISGSTVSTTYTYDLNGNQTAGLGRTVTWTSYNKPATITQGARQASFLHDMDHQRFKQVSTDGTTLYLGAFGVMAELIAPGTAAARWNDYLSVGNVKVGVRFTEVVATTVTTRYFYTDHALREKAQFVLGEMERRLDAVGFTWRDISAVQVYMVHALHPIFADEIVRRGAARSGLTWHYGRPPVESLDYEMDCRNGAWPFTGTRRPMPTMTLPKI